VRFRAAEKNSEDPEEAQPSDTLGKRCACTRPGRGQLHTKPPVQEAPREARLDAPDEVPRRLGSDLLQSDRDHGPTPLILSAGSG